MMEGSGTGSVLATNGTRGLPWRAASERAGAWAAQWWACWRKDPDPDLYLRLTDPGVYLDERPAGGRVHEPHNGGQAALQPHSVLGHFALRVPEKYKHVQRKILTRGPVFRIRIHWFRIRIHWFRIRIHWFRIRIQHFRLNTGTVFPSRSPGTGSRKPDPGNKKTLDPGSKSATLLRNLLKYSVGPKIYLY